jgi:phenylacetate-coenzyme A ligase PaaK-like adenylate-forming protein
MTDLLQARRARCQADFRAKLPAHLERLSWSAERIAAHQASALREVLRNARDRSPFYARRLAGIDPERFSPCDLRRLPTLDKAELMASFDDVVTDRRVTLAAVEATFARTADQPVLLEDEYLCLTSGGSSGLRGVFVWHWQDASDFSLALLRPSLARAQAFGGPPPGGIVAAMVGAGSAVHATRGFPMLVSGDLIHMHSVPATLPFAEIVERLNALRPMTLLCYASLLGPLVEEKRAGRLTIAPFAVSGTSEAFPPELRAEVEKTFGCPVTDSFGSSEGLLGVAVPGENPITLASDLALVELVDERNRPVSPGEPSAKVLLTTLYNRVQPLIRYELTDRMVQHPPSPAHGHVRVTVDGRSDDVFVYGGRTVHPLAVRSVFVKTPEVCEYQVRQTEDGIAVDVVVVAPARLDTETLAARLRAALAGAGLPDPSVSVECVPRIARNAQTGKVARFIARR